MEGIKNISIKIPIDFHKELIDIAEKESRSLTKELLVLIRRGLDSEATKQLKLFD